MVAHRTRWIVLLVITGLVGGALFFARLNHEALNLVKPSLAQEDVVSEGLTATAATLGEASDDPTLFLPFIHQDYKPHFASIFGVQLYGSINESAAALSQLETSGAHWVRWPIAWSAIEPTNRSPADYNWVYDASIRNAYESNLELIVTIWYNPDWAATFRNGPIDKVHLDEFVEFVTALVERYDGDGIDDAPGSPVVRYWEFYNEPDGGVELNAEFGASYWGPFGDQYAQMLCAVYPKMKAANPEAQVVFGGIAYDNFRDAQGNTGAFVREFLGDVLDAGGGDCFDVMNFHYYPPFEVNWIQYGPGISGKAAYLRQNYNLGGKPMMVTEAGWSSEDYSVYTSSPQIQARHVIQLFTQALYSNIEAVTWWTWIDPDDAYGPFGLLTPTFSPKLAYSAFRDAAYRLGTATPQAKLYPGHPNIEVYRFASARNQPLYVLWSRDGNTHAISLPLSKGRVVSMYGNTLYMVTDAADGHIDGQIRVSVGSDPLYVEAVP